MHIFVSSRALSLRNLFWGMSGGGPSGGCRAGLTLERCSQLAVFAIQPVGWDAAAVLWLVEDGIP